MGLSIPFSQLITDGRLFSAPLHVFWRNMTVAELLAAWNIPEARLEYWRRQLSVRCATEYRAHKLIEQRKREQESERSSKANHDGKSA